VLATAGLSGAGPIAIGAGWLARRQRAESDLSWKRPIAVAATVVASVAIVVNLAAVVSAVILSQAGPPEEASRCRRRYAAASP